MPPSQVGACAPPRSQLDSGALAGIGSASRCAVRVRRIAGLTPWTHRVAPASRRGRLETGASRRSCIARAVPSYLRERSAHAALPRSRLPSPTWSLDRRTRALRNGELPGVPGPPRRVRSGSGHGLARPLECPRAHRGNELRSRGRARARLRASILLRTPVRRGHRIAPMASIVGP